MTSSRRRAGFGMALFALFFLSAAPIALSAGQLPDRRPAMLGFGPGSLVNIIDVQKLVAKGQRDAWVMFQCAVADDGVVYGSDFFTTSPDAQMLKDEVRRRLRQTRFIPAVYDGKRVAAWFEGTVVFVVVNGKPHLRLYASQDMDEIKRGTDFVAPQLVFVPNRLRSNWPKTPTVTKRHDAAGYVMMRHSVDADGKTTAMTVLSEHPPGYEFGTYVTQITPFLDFLPGYRNGKPVACSYTTKWRFGRPLGY